MSATSVNRFTKTKPSVLAPPAPPADEGDDAPDPGPEIKYGKRKAAAPAAAAATPDPIGPPVVEKPRTPPDPIGPPVIEPRKRGRPPGAKNKHVVNGTGSTLAVEVNAEGETPAKKPRLGRPKGTLTELKRQLKQYEAELDTAREAYQKVRDEVAETLATAEKAFRVASKIPVAQIGKLQAEILAMKTATD